MKAYIIGDYYSICNEFPKAYKEIGIDALFWLLPDKYSPVYINEADIKKYHPNCVTDRRVDLDNGNQVSNTDNYRFNDFGVFTFIKPYYTELIEIYARRFDIDEKIDIQKAKVFINKVVFNCCKLLRSNQPEIILFTIEPHSLFEYVLYLLSKYYEIERFVFKYTQVRGRYFVCKDIYDYSSNIRNPQNNSNDILSFINEHKVGVSPEYMSQSNKRITNSFIVLFFKFIFDFAIVFRNNILNNVYKLPYYLLLIFKYAWNKLSWVKMIKKYFENNNYLLPDKYIYFPLNYQPEMTTLPNADIYRDLTITIKFLSDNLPKKCVLLIKEHPAFLNGFCYNPYSHRSSEFYNFILELGNVTIVPFHVSTFELQKKARLVATINGTVGFEAAMSKKSVLTFASTWYDFLPNVKNISNVEDLRDLLDDDYNDEYAKTTEIVESLNKNTFLARTGFLDYKKPVVSIEDHIKTVKFLINIQK